VLRHIVHWIAGGAALAAVLLAIAFASVSTHMINPDLDPDSRATIWFFPASARKSDFAGNGWLYRKLQLLSIAFLLVALTVWGLSG
jgi:hypothetical protein